MLLFCDVKVVVLKKLRLDGIHGCNCGFGLFEKCEGCADDDSSVQNVFDDADLQLASLSERFVGGWIWYDGEKEVRKSRRKSTFRKAWLASIKEMAGSIVQWNKQFRFRRISTGSDCKEGHS